MEVIGEVVRGHTSAMPIKHSSILIDLIPYYQLFQNYPVLVFDSHPLMS